MTDSKKKKKTQRIRKAALKQNAISILEQNPLKFFTIKQIAFSLGMMGKKDRFILQGIIEEMLSEKVIEEPFPWKYKMIPKTNLFSVGNIQVTRHGYAFVSIPDMEEDVFISPKNTLNALNGDLVRVSLFKDKRGLKLEGKVVEILERVRKEFVGTIELSQRFAFLVPDNNKITHFFIPMSKINKAKNGEKVVIKFIEWPVGSKNPIGEVIRVLGKAGEHEVEIHAIIEEYGLPYSFHEDVNSESNTINELITDGEIEKRRDFRGITTITIDPPDAKDFDDAISFKKIKEGYYEIGIHIADVSYYIKPETLLDKEAIRRATSVYLVDRTIPMLPEKISNHLCSLRQDEDKLCFSAVFEMDNKAVIKSEWFGRTVINSNRRFSYDEVQEILNNKKGEYAEELMKLNELATCLRNARYDEGSFSFETEEVKFHLDAAGKPLEIFKLIRTDSHMLIEDLMLLANRKVAEFVSRQQDIDFVYRVHDAPNSEKITDFRRIAQKFGYHIDASNSQTLAHSFNELLDEVEGKPEQNFLQSLAIRSMAKANYTTKNIGHYGLAFDHYTHFTSPIRRYPDLMVHRILAEVLEKKKIKGNNEQLKTLCKHCSEREVNAEQAERASIKFKQLEFMSEHIGEVFDGVISGVIESGIFVEIIENKCEGFVISSSLSDDFYIFEGDNYRLFGYNTNKSYTLGQKVRVKVAEINMANRSMDFLLIENN